MLPAIRLCTSPTQLAAVITGATSTFMSAQDEAIQVLQGWEAWLKDSDYLVATQQQVTDALEDIAKAMADPKRTWSWCEQASTLAVAVPDFAQTDKRLAQHLLPAVETLMAVSDRESFWLAIVDLMLCIGAPDVLRAVVAKVTGHGGHREDRPAWACEIAAAVPRPEGQGSRARVRTRGGAQKGRRGRHPSPGGQGDDDSGLSSDYGRRSPSTSYRRDRQDRSRQLSPGPRRGRGHRSPDADRRGHRVDRDHPYRSEAGRDHRSGRDNRGARRDLEDPRDYRGRRDTHARDFNRGRQLSEDRAYHRDRADREDRRQRDRRSDRDRREQEDDRSSRRRRTPDRFPGPPPSAPPPTTKSRAASAPGLPGARHNRA